jgi:uridine kinase
MTFIIGVAGGSGSGKTTVAEKIAEQFSEDQVVVIPHDNYYRDQSQKNMEERVKTNYDHPESLETELLVEQLLKLKQGQSIQMPTYDFVNHTRSEQTREVPPRQVVLIEGILLLENKALREMMDLMIFVDTDADIRFIRRLRRDMAERGRTMEQVVEQYMNTVKPMHETFVEPSKKYADIIVPEGGLNTRAVDVLLARIREMVKN